MSQPPSRRSLLGGLSAALLGLFAAPAAAASPPPPSPPAPGEWGGETVSVTSSATAIPAGVRLSGGLTCNYLPVTPREPDHR